VSLEFSLFHLFNGQVDPSNKILVCIGQQHSKQTPILLLGQELQIANLYSLRLAIFVIASLNIMPNE
jgi:hypothetical protein